MCISKKELDLVVADLRSLKALKEETEDNIKALERIVIDYMTETSQNKIIGSDYKISYSMRSRAGLDKEELQNFFGEEKLKQFEKTTTYPVLRIS